jgi:3-oxoacyl-[acyl-carrier-protein] synthase-1
MATADALKSAGIDPDFIEKQEIGILYGNDSSADAVVKSVDIMRQKNDTTLVGSGAIFQSMNSTVTMNLSCIFKLRGINLTVSGACASVRTPSDWVHCSLNGDCRTSLYAVELRR